MRALNNHNITLGMTATENRNLYATIRLKCRVKVKYNLNSFNNGRQKLLHHQIEIVVDSEA